MPAPSPLVLLPTRRRHIHQHSIVPTAAKLVRASARAHPVRGTLGVGQPIALITPLPSTLRVCLLRKTQLVVAAAGAGVGATGRAARLAVEAEQLAALAPAPAVLPDGRLRARLAVHAGERCQSHDS